MRLAKFISNAGICSRRDAEKLIEAGRVRVAGKITFLPGIISNLTDEIEVDGRLIGKVSKPRLWLYHKPRGLITTHKDPAGRPTVFKNLKDLPRVISVGRLDIDSEGLLLLTNNGDIARYFEHPKYDFERIYRVRVFGDVKTINLKSAENSLIIDNIVYHPRSIKLIPSKNGSNAWYEVVLKEGKNREIRKIFNHFGMQVNRLIRTSYGPFKLENLKAGEYYEVDLKRVNEIVEEMKD